MGTSEHYRQGTLLLDYWVCAIGQWGLLTDGKSTLGSTIIMMESWMIMLVVAIVVMVVVMLIVAVVVMLMVAGEWTRHMAARSA